MHIVVSVLLGYDLCVMANYSQIYVYFEGPFTLLKWGLKIVLEAA